MHRTSPQKSHLGAHDNLVTSEAFWHILSIASCGPTGYAGDIGAARASAGERWPHVQNRFVWLASRVGCACDWGVLGLDIEAAVRARVVLQSLHQPDLHPRTPWPPTTSQGRARAPWDLLRIGEVFARSAGIPTPQYEYCGYDSRTWEIAYRPLLGVGGTGPLGIMADQRWRRAHIEALNSAVEHWVRSGPQRPAGDLVWETIGDDGLHTFCEEEGRGVLEGDPEVAAQFRGAILGVYEHDGSELTSRVQWLTALRTVLGGRLVTLATESLADLRPWPQDEILAWTQDFLSEE